MTARTLLATVLVIGAALLLAACEKDEPATEGPEVPLTTGATTEPARPGDEDEDRPGEGPGGGAVPGAGAGSPRSPEATIELFLSGEDAGEVCEEALTERFLQRAYGDRSGCLAGRNPGSLASAPGVADVVVDGAVATAAARPRGGVYDDQRLDFTLVREGDRWRIDGLDSNVPVGP